MQTQIQSFEGRRLTNLVNLVPANSKYDINGNFALTITVGKSYEIDFGANEVSAVNGAQNFSPPPFTVTFTATNATLTLSDGQIGLTTIPVTAQVFQLN